MMTRYVDVEKLTQRIMGADYIHTACEVLIEIDCMPKEDVAPVIHGHWKEFEDYSGAVYPECSRCGLVWWLDEGTAEDNEMYYCPKCGAKMDEGGRD